VLWELGFMGKCMLIAHANSQWVNWGF